MTQESTAKNTPVFQVRFKGVSASTFENKTEKDVLPILRSRYSERTNKVRRIKRQIRLVETTYR